MRLVITLEDHLFRGKDGCTYGRGPVNYTIWTKYLEFFHEVMLLARVRNTGASPSSLQRVDGRSVFICELPDYRGPIGYLRNVLKLEDIVRQAVYAGDAYLLRIPGLVGRLVWREITRLKKAFAVEVMGDPWDALGPGSIKARLRPLYRRVLTHDTKLICSRADAVLYWSQALQRRYDPGKNSYSVVSPDVTLPQGFANSQQIAERFQRNEARCKGNGETPKSPRIGFVSSLEQMYKGPDVLLHAVAMCKQSGLQPKVFLVGEGRYRPLVAALAARLNIQDQVAFLGQLEFGKPIFDFLDSIDLFVMPSRAEGLPRALVEAMSRACPAIGSSVGGITELLAPDDRVPAGDAKALASKMLEVLGNSERLKQMSQRNLERAKQFDPVTLLERRQAFLAHIRSHSKTAADTPLKLVISAP